MKKIYALIALISTVACAVLLSCNRDPEEIRYNKSPVASAGPDRTITLPKDSVVLNGTASYDPDGTIAKYQWTKLAGPSSFTMTNEGTATAVIQSLVKGIYQMELMVTDNGGASAKDTVQITVNSADGSNLPPVAHAGVDQNLTLPTNYCTLNGSSSFDSDGSIATYQWKKVAGPSTFAIVTPAAVQTNVYNLVLGTYQFELVVTDNAGSQGKDTVQVSVSPSTIITCDLSNRSSINITMTPIGTLSVARTPAVAAAGNKVVFAGGLSSYRNGDFTVSDAADIYDVMRAEWKTVKLSQARMGIAAVSCGTKIFFAGGYSKDGESNNVDIYDVVSGDWQLAHLSVPRSGITAAAVGNKVLFAGGSGKGGESVIVDIYDLENNKWTTATLSAARMFMGSATVGNKVYFAGGEDGWGLPFNTVDIYDNANTANPWSTSSLKQLSGAISGAVVGDQIFWTGVTRNESTSIVEIWNMTDGSVSYNCLTYTRYLLQAVAVNNQVLFSTPGIYYVDNGKNWVDIYNTTTGKWSMGTLNQVIAEAGLAVLNNTLYMGGGGNSQHIFSDKVYALSW